MSASLLEERYGLRVNLIGVTAAGGLVDLRLKVLDAEKAKSLLKDAANFPKLTVTGSDVTLLAAEDSQAQAANLEDGRLLVILYPNRRHSRQFRQHRDGDVWRLHR